LRKGCQGRYQDPTGSGRRMEETMWWVRHEAGMEDKKCRQGFGEEICKTRGQLKDTSADMSII